MAKIHSEMSGADSLYIAGFSNGMEYMIDYLTDHHEALLLSGVDPKTYHAVCLDIQAQLALEANDRHKELTKAALRNSD